MRHLTLLVGLTLPVLACNEPEHWSNRDRATPAEATPEPRDRAADAPSDPAAAREPTVAPVPGPEARTEPASPPPEGDVAPTPTGTDAPAPVAVEPGTTPPRAGEPGSVEPGATQPGVMQPGGVQPGAVASAPQQPSPTGDLATAPRQDGSRPSTAPGQGQPIPGEQMPGEAAASKAPGRQAAAQSTTGQPAASGNAPPAPGAVASGTTQQRAPAPGAVSADPRLTLRGPVTQGGLVVADVQGKVSRVSFPGHRVNVADDGTFLLAFARTAPASEKMTITFADGTTLEQVFQVAQRTYQTDRIEGLPEDEVRVDARDRKEHAAEDARIQAARMKSTDSDCALQGFTWPARGRVTSRYGQPRTINGQEGGIHWGVDLAVPAGTPVAAPACGTIAFAEADVPLSGGTLVIDHGRGVTSTFLHLSGFTKKVGDVVKKGEVVARSGNTGRATGAHLDWRMNFFEVRIDPELLVPAQPGTM